MKWNAPVVDVLLVVACCLARFGLVRDDTGAEGSHPAATLNRLQH